MKNYRKYHSLIHFFPRGCKVLSFVTVTWLVFGFYSALFSSAEGRGAGTNALMGKGRGCELQGSLGRWEATPRSFCASGGGRVL